MIPRLLAGQGQRIGQPGIKVVQDIGQEQANNAAAIAPHRRRGGTAHIAQFIGMRDDCTPCFFLHIGVVRQCARDRHMGNSQILSDRFNCDPCCHVTSEFLPMPITKRNSCLDRDHSAILVVHVNIEIERILRVK